MRNNQRSHDQLRNVQLEIDVNIHAEGSAIVSFGNTRVLCTASIEESIPKWLQGSGKGWVSAEYGMLPRSTNTRIRRDKAMNSGRTQEISRLIARSMRACVDLKKLGERQVNVDCDVLQADGGTRTAAITGGFVALAIACSKLVQSGVLESSPLTSYISAVSVGLTNDNQVLLDLDYEEDSNIGTDMNIVMLSNGEFVELQGTAEEGSFSHNQLVDILAVGAKGCKELNQIQSHVLKEFFPLENA